MDEPEDCRDGCVVKSDAMLGWVSDAGGRLRLEPSDGACAELVVPPDAVSETTPISLRVAHEFPASPDLVANTVYRLAPEGLELAAAATLSLCYTLEAAGTWDAGTFTVHRAVDGVWQDLGGQSDAEALTVSTELTTFALTSNLVAVLRPILDRSPPVVTVSPEPGTVLHGASPLVVTFDEPVEPTSLVLSGSIGTNPPVTVWADSHRKVQVTAAGTWPHGPGQVLTVEVADVNGNVGTASFTFEVDAEAPVPVVTPPSGGGLAPHQAITLSFGEAMRLGSFRLSGELGAESDGGLVFDTDHSFDTLSIGPIGTWGPGNSRQLVVRALDVAGNPVQVNLSYNIDDVGPAAAITPASGSRLSQDATLTVSFTKSIDPQSALLSGDLGAQAAAPSWSTTLLPNDTMHLSPASVWTESAVATLQVQAADVAGNPVQLIAAFVVDNSPPTATLVAPETPPLGEKDPIVVRFSESMRPSTLVLRGHLGRAAGAPNWSITDTSFVDDTLTLRPAGAGQWPRGLQRELWIDVTDVVGQPLSLRWTLNVGDTCGNGSLDSGESCDEGGATATCDADCTAVVCGDGELNTAAGELCDDDNTSGGDGCAGNCLSTEVGFVCDEPGAACGSLCTEDCTALVNDLFTDLDPTVWTVARPPITVQPNGLRLGSDALLSTAASYEPYARDGVQVELRMRLGAARTGVFVRTGTLLYLGRPQEGLGLELWTDRDRVDLKVYPPAGFTLGDSGASPSAIDSRTLAMLNHPATVASDLVQYVSINSANAIINHRNGPDGVLGTGDDDLFDDIAEVDAVEGVGQLSLDSLRQGGELWSAPGQLALNEGDEVRVIINDNGAGLSATVTHLLRNETVSVNRPFALPFTNNQVIVLTMGAGEVILQRATLRTLQLYGCTGAVCDASGTCQDDQWLVAGKPCSDDNPATSSDTCDGFGACVGQ